MFEDIDQVLKAFHKFENSQTPALREIFEVVSAFAPTHETILIQGESGTGKRMLAEAIHELSHTADQKSRGIIRPFIPVNCATLSESLAPSVLFGHLKGAFTDAKEGKKGVVREAEGGTLFLDEIDKLSFSIQGMLLSLLQEFEITPLGAAFPIKVNTRVVVATNKDLDQLVADGAFRHDLLNRVSGFEVQIPRLCERSPDEILSIAEYYLTRNHSKTPGRERRFSEETKRFILSHDWPGNIRQLEKAVTSGFHMAKGPLIMPEDLRIKKDHVKHPDSKALEHALKLAERRAAFIDLLLHMTVREKDGGDSDRTCGAYENELQIALDLFDNDPDIVAETLRLKDKKDLEELHLLARTPSALRQHIDQRPKILLSSFPQA